MNQTQCPRCGSKDFSEVLATPTLVCTNCGKSVDKIELVNPGTTMEDPTKGAQLSGKDEN